MGLLPSTGCPNPLPVSTCSVLFGTGEAILSAAWRALADYIPDDPACGGLDTYVSLGEPPSDCCDVLVVWLTGYGPNTASQTQMARAASPACNFVMEARWNIALIEGCYPVVESAGGQPILPSPDDLHEINRYAYQHGMAMYSGVINEYCAGTLFPDARCPKLRFEPLLPVVPEGGCGGWVFTVSGDLDESVVGSS